VGQRSETGAVFAAGVVQGVAMTIFPATSTIFTSSAYYGLSSTAYGACSCPRP
jgi:hypothetical protein